MEFTPRTVINGRMMRDHMRKNVTLIAKIESADGSRKQLKARTTDNLDITIWASSPVGTKGWVEVIGKPTGPTEIDAAEIIVFESKPEDEEFDSESHNLLVTFLENAGSHFQAV